ncbi:MAG: hypothetical protein ABI776_18360 [Nocardioidaceae bacterium]
MRATYRVLAILVPVIVVLQASFIALGVFGLGTWVKDGHNFTKDVLEHGGATGDVGFALHGFGAMATALVSLLLLAVSFFAKIDGGVKTATLLFLDMVLQWVLAFVAFSAWAVGILHGLNAFVMFGLAMNAVTAANRSIAGATTSPSPAETSRRGA